MHETGLLDTTTRGVDLNCCAVLTPRLRSPKTWTSFVGDGSCDVIRRATALYCSESSPETSAQQPKRDTELHELHRQELQVLGSNSPALRRRGRMELKLSYLAVALSCPSNRRFPRPASFPLYLALAQTQLEDMNKPGNWLRGTTTSLVMTRTSKRESVATWSLTAPPLHRLLRHRLTGCSHPFQRARDISTAVAHVYQHHE
jgi:hypothetical protein